MTGNDVRRIFASKIQGDYIYLPNKSFLKVEEFTELFEQAPNNPTYAELITIDGWTEENAGKGYKTFFDQCKTEGILI